MKEMDSDSEVLVSERCEFPVKGRNGFSENLCGLNVYLASNDVLYIDAEYDDDISHQLIRNPPTINQKRS